MRELFSTGHVLTCVSDRSMHPRNLSWNFSQTQPRSLMYNKVHHQLPPIKQLVHSLPEPNKISNSCTGLAGPPKDPKDSLSPSESCSVITLISCVKRGMLCEQHTSVQHAAAPAVYTHFNSRLSINTLLCYSFPLFSCVFQEVRTAGCEAPLAGATKDDWILIVNVLCFCSENTSLKWYVATIPCVMNFCLNPLRVRCRVQVRNLISFVLFATGESFYFI